MHISGWNIALQTINFVLLMYLLERLLFKPVRAVLTKRQQAADASMREAESKKVEAEGLIEDYRARMGSIARDAQRARDEALAAAEAEARRLRDEAAHQARAEIERGMDQLQRERADALRELEARAAALATSMAQRLLQDALPEGDGAFLWRVTASVDALEPARKAVLARQLAGTSVEAVSARPLDDGVRARLEAWLASLAGQPVAVAYRDDDRLIAGVELRLPAGVWRSHWRGSLDRIQAELKAHAAAA
jgi:F-type H+-transporting ATPase subunit b